MDQIGPIKDLGHPKRKIELQEVMGFEKHKCAEYNMVLLKKLFENDVTRGYGLVLPLEKMKEPLAHY